MALAKHTMVPSACGSAGPTQQVAHRSSDQNVGALVVYNKLARHRGQGRRASCNIEADNLSDSVTLTWIVLA